MSTSSGNGMAGSCSSALSLPISLAFWVNAVAQAALLRLALSRPRSSRCSWSAASAFSFCRPRASLCCRASSRTRARSSARRPPPVGLRSSRSRRNISPGIKEEKWEYILRTPRLRDDMIFYLEKWFQSPLIKPRNWSQHLRTERFMPCTVHQLSTPAKTYLYGAYTFFHTILTASVLDSHMVIKCIRFQLTHVDST